MSHVRAPFLGGDVREDFGRLASTEVERGQYTGSLVPVLHRASVLLAGGCSSRAVDTAGEGSKGCLVKQKC
eukprot:4138508-Amphidinium_carterae.1